MAYVYATCTVRVTIFNTGVKFQLVSSFTESHALTLAAHSYALLAEIIIMLGAALNHLSVEMCKVTVTAFYGAPWEPWEAIYKSN